MLAGKKVLLGVTGSIAAYKAAFLTRLLIKEGAAVKVVMTAAASDFITPLTLATLSKNPVLNYPFNPQSGEWHSHVEAGLWADLMVIAPATANTIAHLAHGICENLLSAIYLSARCPVIVCPAMDLDMYAHPATVKNMVLLEEYGNILIKANYGELASGLTGDGRMAEPEQIVAEINEIFNQSNSLKDKKVLVTAGPTYEAIDPVRFIGNHSSGKMGTAIALEAAKQGASVDLILGPAELKINHPKIKVHRIKSAAEMYEACIKIHPNTELAFFSAAVSDYKPMVQEPEKIKKSDPQMVLTLEKTKDIAMELGQLKQDRQIHIGFALETENEIENGKKKLLKKNFDLLVLNSLRDQGAGFGFDTNKVTFIDQNGNLDSFELESKQKVARNLIKEVIRRFL